jgi:hypothetical protein
MGNNYNGVVPANSLVGAVVYQTTLGPDGKISAGGFDENTLALGVTHPDGYTVDSANSVDNSIGGTLYENIEEIRKNAPLSIRTLNRMVTRPDHKDVMEMVPGVAKAAVQFCCGKKISLYIAPDGGGVASTSLINTAQGVAETTKIATTFPEVKPAGETRLVVGGKVTRKKRKTSAETLQQVKDALTTFGSIDFQEINGAIRLSDIQALIDNLPAVDFVDLTVMYTKPYARPINSTNVLVWTNTTSANSTQKVRWRVEYDGMGFRVFKNNTFISNLAVNVEFNDNALTGFKFKISAGPYSNGDAWEFTVYPYMQNLSLDDFTLFTIKEEDLFFTILAPSEPESIC